MYRRRFRVTVICIALSLLAGVIGSLATIPNVSTWYAGLIVPPFNPPAWVFGPVWNTLYIMMGIAAAQVWCSHKPGYKKALALFFAHLAVNASWSLVFFGFHLIGPALGIIILLWLMILALILTFGRYSRPAALLLVPYLLWVSFATVLNAYILVLN